MVLEFIGTLFNDLEAFGNYITFTNYTAFTLTCSHVPSLNTCYVTADWFILA